MSPLSDLRRRDEPPPASGGAFPPPGLRSEAFAEDLADLLVPDPLPLAGVAGAAPRARPGWRSWFTHRVIPAGAPGT